MNLHHRSARTDEIRALIHYIDHNVPIARSVLHRLLPFLTAALADQSAQLRVLEDVDQPPAARVLAAAGAVFISDTARAKLLRAPKPDVSALLLGGAADTLLTRSEIAAANAQDGLNLVVVPYAERLPSLPEDAAAHVRASIDALVASMCSGYKIRTLLLSCRAGAPAEGFIQQGWTRVSGQTQDHDDPDAVTLLQLEVGAGCEGAIHDALRWQAPRWALRAKEQQALAAVMDAADTRAAAAGQLGISAKAMEQRWLAIVARVAERDPAILADVADDPDLVQQHILDHVRTHPEELRPYDWRFREAGN